MKPIPAEILAKRLKQFRTRLAQAGVDVALVSHPKHIYYLSGWMPGASPTFLIIDGSDVSAIAPLPLGEVATSLYVDYDIWNGWDTVENACHCLQQHLRRYLAQKITLGLELAFLPVVYQQAVSDFGACVDLGGLLWKQRTIKDEAELDCIQENIALNDTLFTFVRDTLTPDMREMDLWGRISHAMFVGSGSASLLEGDLGGGKRGVDLGAQPSNEPLEKGDVVFIDIYSSHNGYYADTTRVFVLGRATEKQRSVHAILEEALHAAEAVLKPGIPACRVDEAVRQVVKKYGYGDFFPHHTGHAYGLFQQERPFLIPAEQQILEAGMVIAIEPGIYLPDWGGMRLEGNYILKSGGYVRMDRYPSELTEITRS